MSRPALVAIWVRHRDGGYRWALAVRGITRPEAEAEAYARFNWAWWSGGGSVVILPAGERPDRVRTRHP